MPRRGRGHMCKLLSQLRDAGEEETPAGFGLWRRSRERETDWRFDPLTSKYVTTVTWFPEGTNVYTLTEVWYIRTNTTCEYRARVYVFFDIQQARWGLWRSYPLYPHSIFADRALFFPLTPIRIPIYRFILAWGLQSRALYTSDHNARSQKLHRGLINSAL